MDTIEINSLASGSRTTLNNLINDERSHELVKGLVSYNETKNVQQASQPNMSNFEMKTESLPRVLYEDKLRKEIGSSQFGQTKENISPSSEKFELEDCKIQLFHKNKTPLNLPNEQQKLNDFLTNSTLQTQQDGKLNKHDDLEELNYTNQKGIENSKENTENMKKSENLETNIVLTSTELQNNERRPSWRLRMDAGNKVRPFLLPFRLKIRLICY